MVHHHFNRAAGLKQRLSRQQPDCNTPQTIDVRAGIQLAAAGGLRRHVAGSSSGNPNLRELGHVVLLGAVMFEEPEIQNFDEIVVRPDPTTVDVAGFYISMYQPVF